MTSSEPVLPASRRGWILVLAVLGLALVFRVGFVFENRAGYAPVSDAADFNRIANSIANGDGFGETVSFPATGPSALRAPLYPAALAAVYAVFGDDSFTAGRLANAAAGMVVVALVGVIATQLFGRRVGFVAMAIAAVHPAMILVGTSLQLEPMLVALSLGAVAATLQHLRSPSGLVWPFVTGVLIGLAVLTRELGVALIPPTVWMISTASGARKRDRFRLESLAGPLTLVVAATLVVFPWTVRNAVRIDEFVPVSNSAGVGLAGMFNDTARTDKDHPAQWILPYEDPGMAEIILEDENPTEYELDSRLRDASIEVLRDHPSYLFTVFRYNVYRMFDLDGGDYSRVVGRYSPYPKRLTTLAIGGSYVVLLAAIAGVFRRQTRQAPFGVWGVPIILLGGVLLFLPASIRYRASIEPYFVLLAAVAVTPLLEEAARKVGLLKNDD